MSPSHPLVRWAPALLFLMAVHGAFLFSWAKKNSAPCAWDQAIHTKIAMDYRDQLFKEPLLDVLMPKSFSYPPLYHLAMVPALGWVSEISEAGLPVNFFYLCVLIAAVFLIGTDLMGPREGFTAAALVASYPLLFDLGRTTLIDLSLTAWVAVVFYCLIRSRHFSNAAGSALFGASLGLAMLTKWTALAYVFFPLVFSIGCALRERRWRNLALGFLLCGLVMSPWYAQNIIPVAVQLPILSGLPPASGENMTGWAKVFWYPLSLPQQMGFPLVLLFLPGLAAVAWRPKLLPVVLWFVGSLVLFSLIRNKNIRYFAPALPAVALLSAAWLPSFRRIAAFAVLAGAMFLFVSYNRSHPATEQDWQHERILERIREVHGAALGPANVLMVANEPYFHGASLRLTARASKETNVSVHSPSKARPFEFADFVIFKTGSLGPGFTLGNINKCAEEINKPNGWFSETFKEVGRWPLPYGSEAVLYHSDPRPQNIPDAGLFNLSLSELDLPRIKATGVELRATPLSSADTRAGRFKELRVRCDRLIYKSIEFRDVLVRLIRPQVNLPLFFETQEIQLCRLGALEPHATIDAGLMLDVAAKKAPWLKEPSIRFDGTAVDVKGRAAGIPVVMSAEVTIHEKTVASRVKNIRIAGIPVPLIFVRAVLNRTVPLGRGGDWAYDINIAKIHGSGPSLRIGPE